MEEKKRLRNIVRRLFRKLLATFSFGVVARARSFSAAARAVPPLCPPGVTQFARGSR